MFCVVSGDSPLDDAVDPYVVLLLVPAGGYTKQAKSDQSTVLPTFPGDDKLFLKFRPRITVALRKIARLKPGCVLSNCARITSVYKIASTSVVGGLRLA